MMCVVVRYQNNYHIDIQWQEKDNTNFHDIVKDSNGHQCNFDDIYHFSSYQLMIQSHSELIQEYMIV